MNVSESSAVFTLLRWAGHEPVRPLNRKVTDDEVVEAFAFLAVRAGNALSIPGSTHRNEVLAAARKLVDRLRAAEPAGAAQAVCEAMSAHAAAARRAYLAGDWTALEVALGISQGPEGESVTVTALLSEAGEG